MYLGSFFYFYFSKTATGFLTEQCNVGRGDGGWGGLESTNFTKNGWHGIVI
jgi:hypothetical protein